MGAQIRDVAEKFRYDGEIISVVPMGNGMVNDTFSVVTDRAKYTLQRINGEVFKNVREMTENIVKVTRHIAKKRYIITPVALKSGGYLWETEGGYYRSFTYADGVVRERAETPKDAFSVGLGFGRFQNDLSDFRESLFETIPDFHNTPERKRKFFDSLKEDKFDRAKIARETIEGYIDYGYLSDLIVRGLKRGKFPKRVAHNDTKINNIVLDKTGGIVSVIDLDTVMEGSLLYDFGDMTRSICNLGGEAGEFGEPRLEREYYEELLNGFCKGVGDCITREERDNLPTSAAVLTYECGMRFLTDYLDGDVYFKTTYDGQNLARAKGQLAYLTDIMNNISYMEGVGDAIFGK